MWFEPQHNPSLRLQASVTVTVCILSVFVLVYFWYSEFLFCLSTFCRISCILLRLRIGTRCRPGWMKKSLFIQNWIGSQVIRNTYYRVVRQRVVNQKRNQNIRQNRQGLGRIGIVKQLVQYLNKLAYTNRHRIMINILMARQTYRLEYLYTGKLKILRGSWDVRRD